MIQGNNCLPARASPANQWLRTPNSDNANNVRLVNSDGSMNNNNANNANAHAPDCEIARLQ